MNLSNAVIKAQDLAGTTVVDITLKVKINGNDSIIPGAVINTIGTGEQTLGDTSEPVLVIVILDTRKK